MLNNERSRRSDNVSPCFFIMLVLYFGKLRKGAKIDG